MDLVDLGLLLVFDVEPQSIKDRGLHLALIIPPQLTVQLALLSFLREAMLPSLQGLEQHQLSLLLLDDINYYTLSLLPYHVEPQCLDDMSFERALIVLVHVALLDLVLHRLAGEVHPVGEVPVSDVCGLVVLLERVQVLLLL